MRQPTTLPVVAAALLFALAGCTMKTTEGSGTGGGDGTGGRSTSTGTGSAGGGTGGGSPWGTRTDIEAIFASDCGQCHNGAWSSCWNVHDSAGAIEPAIEQGFMPRGSTMAPADKAAVLAWLAQGAPCVGTEPDAGMSTAGPPSGTGAATP